MAPEGLAVCESGYEPAETMDRLVAAAKKSGMSIVARVDHAAAAAKAGMDMRPTELLIFGNPKVGTKLMQAAQTMGIDLPLKALVWQDDRGKTWLAYNDPKWLAARHGVEDAALDHFLTAMISVLALVAKEATGRH
jgi:uncharacterized protein (DUF302 family)